MKLHFDKYKRAKEKDELTIGADVSGYDKPWTWHSNQLRLNRGSLNDSPRSASTGSAPRHVIDDTRDSVNFPTNLLDAVAPDDGTEDSDRPRSTNDADDITTYLNDMLYTSLPDLLTQSPFDFPSQAPPQALELPPSVTVEGLTPLHCLICES
uniref:Uncharacterized protein n=1 Tax=Plectus sambesii TaxID=2011161 RepID=A0A914VJQ5_9BILA